MSRSIARSALVLATLLAFAACTSATAPTSQAKARDGRHVVPADTTTMHPDCGGGVLGGTGTC